MPYVFGFANLGALQLDTGVGDQMAVDGTPISGRLTLGFNKEIGTTLDKLFFGSIAFVSGDASFSTETANFGIPEGDPNARVGTFVIATAGSLSPFQVGESVRLEIQLLNFRPSEMVPNSDCYDVTGRLFSNDGPTPVVPEPTTIALVGMGLVAVLRRRS